MGEEFPQCGKGWVNPVGSPGLSGIIRTTVVIYNYTEDEPGLPTVRNMSRQSDESNPKIRCPLAACVTLYCSLTTVYSVSAVYAVVYFQNDRST